MLCSCHHIHSRCLEPDWPKSSLGLDFSDPKVCLTSVRRQCQRPLHRLMHPSSPRAASSRAALQPVTLEETPVSRCWRGIVKTPCCRRFQRRIHSLFSSPRLNFVSSPVCRMVLLVFRNVGTSHVVRSLERGTLARIKMLVKVINESRTSQQVLVDVQYLQKLVKPSITFFLIN